ncbi:MAG: hypothetical protein ACRECY_01395 [Phyllobacterium sp.]
MASIEADTDLGVERRWRRRSLWALLVIVPLALLAISYNDLTELARYRNIIPIEVSAGQTVRYGGSDWQFQGLRNVAESVKPGRLPKDTAPIIARFVVEIGDPDMQNLWLMCAIKLNDTAGRTWFPTAIMGLRRPAEGIETCLSAAFSGAQTGRRMVIEERYLVPSSVADELFPTLGVMSERPHYLRFALP